MATKASSKTATRKPAPKAFGTGAQGHCSSEASPRSAKSQGAKKGASGPGGADRTREAAQEPAGKTRHFPARHPAPGDCLAD